MRLLCRSLPDEQRRRLESCAAEIFATVGMDPDTPAARDTPRRYIQALFGARHLCTEMRGVRETSPVTRTTFWRGEYDRDAALRAEFLAASGLER